MSAAGVMRSAAVVSLCTAVSRVLGLAREILMATFFGTSLAQSAFVVAFKVPNLFRRLFGEGALSAAFVPVFSESLEKDGREASWALAARVMGMLSAFLAIVVIVGMVLISVVMAVLPPGGRAAMTLPLLRIMLPYTLFICLVALCMAILNSFRHFALPAMTPVILNTVWILALLVVCPQLGETPESQIPGVAWAVLVAGVLQLVIQLPMLRRFGFQFRVSFQWRDARVKRVLALMAPAAIGMGIHQINVVVDGLLAFVVGDWAPAALSYAERLIYLPLGVFATALGTVLLPVFSTQAAQQRNDELLSTMHDAIRNLSFIMIPAAVGLLVLAAPIIELTYMWAGGKFDSESLWQTTRALQFYAPGLFVFSLYKIFVPAFYAVQDTRTPVRIGIMAVILNLVLNVTFILTWPVGYKHAGLACATVLASAFSCVALAVTLQRRLGSPGWARISVSVGRIFAAALVMGVSAWWVHRFAAGWIGDISIPDKLSHLAGVGVAIVCGVMIYMILAAVLCRAELDSVRRGWRSRGKRVTG